MSKILQTRVDKLEQQSGHGGTIFAVYDEEPPLIDGEPVVHISGSDIHMKLSEFKAQYPDGVIFRFVYGDISKRAVK